MSEILQVAFDVILPILLVVGVSVVVARRFDPDPQTVTHLLVYILIPSLVFESLANATINQDELMDMLLYVAVLVVVLLGVGYLYVRSQDELAPTVKSAFLASLIVINTGNFGLPFIEFALGEAGLERAVIIMVITFFVTFSVGVYVASWGAVPLREGFLNIFRTPLVYSVLLGAAANGLDIRVPLAASRAISLLADATVPVMLILLGIQLARISFAAQSRAVWRAVLVASALRLLLSPLLIWGLSAVLGIEGATRTVALLQLSMPVGVNTTVLATEFGSDAQFASAAILVSTLGSIITLSLLLAWIT